MDEPLLAARSRYKTALQSALDKAGAPPLGHQQQPAPLSNRTFTTPSPGRHRRSRAGENTGVMQITGSLLFMAAVTCYLLARVFGGAAHPAEVVVYGATAALGLEFLMACWGELWRES
jgi:hypothetical protein